MKISKKLLSVVMAVVMLLSCFVVMASAYTYAPTNTTGEVKFITTADKTTVKPGDVVKFYLRIDPGTKTNLSAMNSVVVYSSSQLTPVGSAIADFRTWEGDFGTSFANPAAGGNMNLPVAQLAAYTAEEKAYFDKAIQIAGTGTSSASRWNPAANEAFVSFQMTVSSSVKPGDEIWVGMHQAAFTRGVASLAIDGVRQANTVFDLTDSMLKLIVEEDKEPSPVFNKNSQIRFNAAPVGDAKADFDVRTRGYIAADALEALCGGSVTEDAIADVGFVFFAGEDIDLATAAEVAKNGSTGAYTRKQCSYVQATGSEYVWTCMVTDPAYDGTLQSVAYITVGGETYITDAAQETSFADLYDRNIDSYLGA